jgi:hypothetical protein
MSISVFTKVMFGYQFECTNGGEFLFEDEPVDFTSKYRKLHEGCEGQECGEVLVDLVDWDDDVDGLALIRVGDGNLYVGYMMAELDSENEVSFDLPTPLSLEILQDSMLQIFGISSAPSFHLVQWSEC